MSVFSKLFNKKHQQKALSSREKVLQEVERLRLSKAKSQAMAVLEVAFRKQEITAFDYESEKTLLLNEFD